MKPVRNLGRNVAGNSRRSPNIFSRRDLKKKRYEAEGAKEYREANRGIQKAVKKAKEDWIGVQCEEIETSTKRKKEKTIARQHISFNGEVSNLRETG